MPLRLDLTPLQAAYVECALWASIDWPADGGEPVDGGFDDCGPEDFD